MDHDKLFRIGDRVVTNFDSDTIGTVIGFERRIIYHSYADFPIANAIEPGIYYGNGSPIVKWDTDNRAAIIASAFIQYADKAVSYGDVSEYEYREAFSQLLYRGGLPATKYMEGMSGVVYVQHVNPTAPVAIKIISVNYEQASKAPVATRDDMLIYLCSIEGTSKFKYISGSDILFITDKGNHWKWFNGHKDELEFQNIEDEINFYITKGIVKYSGRTEDGNIVPQGRTVRLALALKLLHGHSCDQIMLSAPVPEVKLNTLVRIAWVEGNDDLKRRMREYNISRFAGFPKEEF